MGSSMGLNKIHIIIMRKILVAHLLFVQAVFLGFGSQNAAFVSSWQLFEAQVHCAWNACPVPFYIVQLTTKKYETLSLFNTIYTITTGYNLLQFYVSFAALVLKIFGAYSRFSRSK